MIAKKKILFLLASSALLVSCGGGGDDPPASAPVQPPSTGNPSPAGSGASPANPSTPVNTTPVAVDQHLNGQLDVVANQILYIRANRVIYLPVILSEFESDRGIVDMAPGSPTDHVDIDVVGAHCNPAVDGLCGIQPPAAAPVAPIAAFGIRVSKLVSSAEGQAMGNQTVEGRIAVDLTERDDSPGVGTKDVAEIMRFIIDKVEMSVDQNGELTSVKVLDGGKIHVYGRTASGLEVQDDIPAPAGTVRLLPMTDVPDSHGDTSSTNLLLDLETGFSQASPKLDPLKNIAGHFSMHVTLSSVQKMVRLATKGSADNPAVDAKELVGETITINGQAPVSGAGINGNAWIRSYP